VPVRAARLAIVTKRPEHGFVGAARRLAIVTLLTGLVVALLGCLAPMSSASPLLHPQTRVAAAEHPAGHLVGPHSSVLAVQGRERAPIYDQDATGSSVAAEDGTAATGPGNGIGPGAASVNDPSFINGVPADSDLGQAIQRGASTTTDDDAVFQHLEKYNGVSPEQASAELHDIKSGMEGNPDVVFTWSGGVYDATSGDYLGTLIP